MGNGASAGGGGGALDLDSVHDLAHAKQWQRLLSADDGVDEADKAGQQAVFDKLREKRSVAAVPRDMAAVAAQFSKATGVGPPLRDSAPVAACDGCTLLHIAAQQDNVDVVRALVRRGASLLARDANGKTAADLAHGAVSVLLDEGVAVMRKDGLWKRPSVPGLLASSNRFSEATERTHGGSGGGGGGALRVAYGGGVATVPPGTVYYEDRLSRVLVGWHGSVSPPGGMDGESMLSH